jgi:hypothetical protein
MSQGRDPTPQIDVAQANIQKGLTLLEGKSAEATLMLAQVQRFRAEWLQKQKRPIDALVRRGLELTARARAQNAELHEALAVEGVLHLLSARTASDPATRIALATRARTAIEQALAKDAYQAQEYRAWLDEATRLSAP